jgi:hypothetical protein
MSQYPSDYFSQHYVDQNYTQQVPNQTNSTLEVSFCHHSFRLPALSPSQKYAYLPRTGVLSFSLAFSRQFVDVHAVQSEPRLKTSGLFESYPSTHSFAALYRSSLLGISNNEDSIRRCKLSTTGTKVVGDVSHKFWRYRWRRRRRLESSSSKNDFGNSVGEVTRSVRTSRYAEYRSSRTIKRCKFEFFLSPNYLKAYKTLTLTCRS